MWITHLTQAERDFYSNQPTAQKMHEKMLRDGIYIPEGDKAAAAAFVAQRDAKKANRQGSADSYIVELSDAAKAMKEKAGKQGAGVAMDDLFLGKWQSRQLQLGKFLGIGVDHQS